MDMNALMNMAKGVQDRMKEAEAEAAKLRVEGDAGGGMVKVTLDGKFRVVKVDIDSKLIGDDVSMLEDLVAAAFNQAVVKVGETLQQSMSQAAGIPGFDLSQFGFPTGS